MTCFGNDDLQGVNRLNHRLKRGEKIGKKKIKRGAGRNHSG